jgi:hypothetical protein
MTSNKEMKLLIEGFNKFLNETVKSREFEEITTGEVEFNWGSYSSFIKDEKYFIKSDEDTLGDVQQNGDPYTYKNIGNGKWMVISAPESGKQSIGATISAPCIDESAPSINLTVGLNFDKLKSFYKAYDFAVEKNKEMLDSNEGQVTGVGGRDASQFETTQYAIAKRKKGRRASIPAAILKKMPEDIKTTYSEVSDYEALCRRAIVLNHQKLDSFVIDLAEWARGLCSEDGRAETVFNVLKRPIKQFIETLNHHPLIRERPDLEKEMRNYLWNLTQRNDQSLSTAEMIAYDKFLDMHWRWLAIMLTPQRGYTPGIMSSRGAEDSEGF